MFNAKAKVLKTYLTTFVTLIIFFYLIVLSYDSKISVSEDAAILNLKEYERMVIELSKIGS